MDFKDGSSGRMAKEFKDKIHPELRSLLLDFDAWSATEKLPAPVITMLGRTMEEERDIYLNYWGDLIVRLKADDRTLSPKLRAIAEDKMKKTPAVIEAEALNLFSYHLCWCAADLRDRHYDKKTELPKVLKWLKERCMYPMWLVLEHDVTAPHIHVQRTDYSWRHQYDPRSKPKGAV